MLNSTTVGTLLLHANLPLRVEPNYGTTSCIFRDVLVEALTSPNIFYFNCHSYDTFPLSSHDNYNQKE